MSIAQAFPTKHAHLRVVRIDPRQLAIDFSRKRPPRYPQPDADGCYTLGDIGEEIDLSVERARQIEVLAMEKLRVVKLIEQFVGLDFAELIADSLRGRSLPEYRAKLDEVRSCARPDVTLDEVRALAGTRARGDQGGRR